MQIDKKDEGIILMLEETRYLRSEKNLSGVASDKAEKLMKLEDGR